MLTISNFWNSFFIQPLLFDIVYLISLNVSYIFILYYFVESLTTWFFQIIGYTFFFGKQLHFTCQCHSVLVLKNLVAIMPSVWVGWTGSDGPYSKLCLVCIRSRCAMIYVFLVFNLLPEAGGCGCERRLQDHRQELWRWRLCIYLDSTWRRLSPATRNPCRRRLLDCIWFIHMSICACVFHVLFDFGCDIFLILFCFVFYFLIWFDLLWFALIWLALICFDLTCFDLLWFDLFWFGLYQFHSQFWSDLYLLELFNWFNFFYKYSYIFNLFVSFGLRYWIFFMIVVLFGWLLGLWCLVVLIQHLICFDAS